MDITISPAACPGDTYLLWDTVWNPVTQQADWALADPDEIHNRGGLRAKSAIATAVIIALFTDRACPPDHPLFKFADGDPRGWWGDGILFDDEEGPMGSLLWLLERAVVKAERIDMARWAETFAYDALAFLKTQNAVASIAAKAEAYPNNRSLVLAITLAGSDGQNVFDAKFDILWQQMRGGQ
jgi:phage gp46-like protein